VDAHLGAAAVDDDAEFGALHDRREIGGPDAEMRRCLTFDLEQRAAEILQHLDDAAAAARRRNAELGARRDDDIFPAAHQHGAAAGAGEDEVPGPERGAAASRLEAARLAELHRSGGLADGPGGRGARRLANAEAQKREQCNQDAHRQDPLPNRRCRRPARIARQRLNPAHREWQTPA